MRVLQGLQCPRSHINRYSLTARILQYRKKCRTLSYRNVAFIPKEIRTSNIHVRKCMIRHALLIVVQRPSDSDMQFTLTRNDCRLKVQNKWLKHVQWPAL